MKNIFRVLLYSVSFLLYNTCIIFCSITLVSELSLKFSRNQKNHGFLAQKLLFLEKQRTFWIAPKKITKIYIFFFFLPFTPCSCYKSISAPGRNGNRTLEYGTKSKIRWHRTPKTKTNFFLKKSVVSPFGNSKIAVTSINHAV